MQVIDLSVGGCLVATTDPVPAGSDVTLHVTLAGIDMGFTGRVVHVQPGRGFAVEFRNFATEAQQQLEAFLAAALTSD
jgi:hypothetical protein